jgi:hypothetical protein
MFQYDAPDYYEDEYVAKEVKQLQDKIDECGEFLSAIVDALYSKEPLDKSLLEWRLDELCHKLGVKINAGTLEIERRNTTISSLALFMASSPINRLDVAFATN